MKLHPDTWINVFNDHDVNLEIILKDTAVNSCMLYDNGTPHFVIGPHYPLQLPVTLTEHKQYHTIMKDILTTMQDYIVMQPRPVWEQYFEEIRKNGPDYN